MLAHAGFRRGKSTINQFTLLTQKIENSFSAEEKAAAVFVDFTAAYDTVWHRGLTCMVMHLLPDKRMFSMIMKLVCNRSFTPTTGSKSQSSLRRLENGLSQGLVLVPLVACRASHFIELPCQTSFCLFFYIFFISLLSVAWHLAPTDVCDSSCLM